MVEWKVGQKYTHDGGSNINICIGFTTRNTPVVEFPNGGVALVYSSQSHLWKEYKEPLKGEYWVNIYPNSAGILHPTKEKADQHQKEYLQRIACVRVPWTEGEGL